MFKKITIGIVVLLFLGLAVSNIHAQWKKQTISQIIPSAENWHSDRFFATGTYDSLVSTDPTYDTIVPVIGPFPYRTKIRGAWYRQLGIATDCDDSIKIILLAGNGINTINDSIVADTLFLGTIAGTTDSTNIPFDSTFQAFTFDDPLVQSNRRSYVDTISRFQVISLAAYNGKDAKNDSVTSLKDFILTIEFEIIE